MAMAADRRLSRGIWRAGLLAFGFAGAASAQVSGYGTSSAVTPPSTSAGTPQDAANAKPAHGKGGWLIVPSIVLRGTVTDNVDQAPNGQARSDFITEVIPGIRIDGNGAHAKLHLDYQMDNLIYARDSSRNNLQNLDVAIPLGLFVCVTGVSGSGKSTLVNEILFKKLYSLFHDSRVLPGAHDALEGVEHLLKLAAEDAIEPRESAAFTLEDEVRIIERGSVDDEVRLGLRCDLL